MEKESRTCFSSLHGKQSCQGSKNCQQDSSSLNAGVRDTRPLLFADAVAWLISRMNCLAAGASRESEIHFPEIPARLSLLCQFLQPKMFFLSTAKASIFRPGTMNVCFRESTVNPRYSTLVVGYSTDLVMLIVYPRSTRSDKTQ